MECGCGAALLQCVCMECSPSLLGSATLYLQRCVREKVFTHPYTGVFRTPIIKLIGALAYEGRKGLMDVPLLEDPLFTICLGLGIWTGIGCCVGWGIGFILRCALEKEGNPSTKK